jgi:predicted nucleic acid-binding protein
MIVVDSNVIAYMYLEGEFTEDAISVWQNDSDWAAPILWRSEFRNILASNMRFRSLSMEDALKMMQIASIQLQEHEYEIGSALVMRLVKESNCSAYDCEYVALAMTLGVLLVTEDQQILAQFPDVTRSMARFAESE